MKYIESINTYRKTLKISELYRKYKHLQKKEAGYEIKSASILARIKIFSSRFRLCFIAKVTFEQRREGSERVSHKDTLG